MNHKSTSLLLALLALSFQPAFGASLGTSFTYQGRLSSGTNAAAGLFDLTFSVWSASTGAAQVGSTLTNAAVGVTNGLFAVMLDFGSGVFDGNARWLEVGVRTNGNGSFVTLAPRQALAATPYAQYAPSAGAAAQASAVTAGAITTSMLANGAVTSSKIGAAAVKPSNIDDGGNAIYQGFLNSASSMDSTAPLPYRMLSLVSSNSGAAPSFSFTLDAGAFGTVVSFTGHEGMSEPYAYVVEALAAPGLLDPNAQMGRQGRLSFGRNGRTTAFAGLVTGCSVSSYDGTNDCYTFRLESPLAYLALNSDYRIYQQQSIPDIVASLYQGLTAYPLVNSLNGTYAPTANTIQYAETALNFFRRQLESEGIFCFFNLDGTPPSLNLADSPSAYPAGNVTTFLYYGDTSTNIPAGAEFIRSFQKAERQSTKVSLLNAYDFTKPQTDLTQMASSSDGLGQGTNYQFDATIFDISMVRAHVRAQQARQDLERSTYFGTANGPDLRAGYTFTLTDQTGSSLGKTYLVTSVQHAAFRRTTNGVASFYYGNQFEVIPSTMAFRPAPKTPKPVALPCMANVTGPTGEEIYVDKYGRVKVQFRWDRYGANDESSSAWLRVASPWAGQGRGMLFLPRIGDEVMVEFVQGDPDQPVVTGCFYNEVAMPPYALPANQTRSIIKTISSKGGGGANEIMFEDKKASELLAITAEKDFTLSANHDISISATHDLSITAGQGMGINTTSDPVAALDVRDSSGNSGTIHVGADAVGGEPKLVRFGDGDYVHIGENGADDWMDLKAATFYFNHSSGTGNVGIGTNNPQAALHVVGNILASGTVTANTFTGNGAGLANLSASQLTSGTVPLAQLPAAVVTNSATGLTINGTISATSTVYIDANALNNGGLSPALIFGGSASSEGIASKRGGAITNGQYALDFYTSAFLRMRIRNDGNVGIANSNPTNLLMVQNARCDGSSWINSSDRNLKQDFAPVNPQEVLAQVAALPVQSWSYKAQPSQKHLGPVAQDFHAAFGLGADDTSIATVDESGVALAAIQGLNQKLDERNAEIQALKRQNDSLERRLKALELLVSSVTEKN